MEYPQISHSISSEFCSYLNKFGLLVAKLPRIARVNETCTDQRSHYTSIRNYHSILRQLVFQEPKLPSEIAFLKNLFGKRGTTPALKGVFDATVSLVTRFSSVFIFFDAFDEYDDST